MSKINRLEQTMALSIVKVLKRASKLKGKDQLALIKEYSEWLNGTPIETEILVIDEFTFDNCNF